MLHRVLRSPEASVSPGDLSLNETPKPRKQRPPLPPGVTVKPVYPGASYGIHPVDKLGIKLSEAKLLETPLPAGEQPPPPPAEPSPEPPPQPAPQPQPQPQPEPSSPVNEPQPSPEPKPDFSDLPGGNGNGAGEQQQQEEQRDPAHEANAHRSVVGAVWDGFIAMMVAFFGEEWFPRSPQERAAVVEAWVQALLWLGTRILNPLQIAYAATALYCLSRLFTILRWWQNRRARAQQQREEAEHTVDVENEKGAA